MSGWSRNKRIVRLFIYFQFIEKNVVFGFFSDIENESFIFAVFRRRTSVWTKAGNLVLQEENTGLQVN